MRVLENPFEFISERSVVPICASCCGLMRQVGYVESLFSGSFCALIAIDREVLDQRWSTYLDTDRVRRYALVLKPLKSLEEVRSVWKGKDAVG